MKELVSKVRLWSRLCLLCIPLMFLQGCEDEKEDGRKVLKMATSADYPPFEFYDRNQIVGFDVDLARMITKKLGYDLKVLDMDFIGIIPALQSGRVDFAMSAINPTSKRAENVNFSNIYYHNDASFLYIKDGVNDDLLNFENKKFGAQVGTVFEDFLQERKREFSKMQVLSLPKIPLLIEDLKMGRIDAILLDRQIANRVVSKIQNSKTLPVSNFNFGAAIAFPKGKEELVKQFNSVLVELSHNGEIEALREKWFGHLKVKDDSKDASSQSEE